MVAALGLSMVLHLAYSCYGYGAVDEGMIHAMSRRLLNGEVPHRDFIFSRTALSPMLMTPLVALDSPRLMLMSRYVWWLEMTATAFLWTAILGRSFPALLGLGVYIPTSVLSLMLSVHIFPPMVWYTTDGVFLSTLGLWSLGRTERPARVFGGVALGLAVLAKQNFAVMPVLALVAGGGGFALLSALPVSLYFGALTLADGVGDFVVQQMGHSDLLKAGLYPYTRWATGSGAGLAVWIALTATFAGQQRWPTLRLFGRRFANATLAALLALWACYPERHVGLSMSLFWATAIYAFALRHEVPGGWRTALVPLGLAWASAVSNGWQSRALGGAGLAVLAVAIWLHPEGESAPGALRTRTCLLWAMALASLSAHHFARMEATYADRPRAELVHDLGPLLPGFAGIYTSERTFGYIEEAERLSREYGTRGHAIIPDFPGHWVPRGRVNPLPIDWVFAGDLPTPELIERVTRVIDGQKGRIVILVGRDNATLFDRVALAPYRRGQNPIVDHVTSRWTVVHRGRYFTVYE